MVCIVQYVHYVVGMLLDFQQLLNGKYKICEKLKKLIFE